MDLARLGLIVRLIPLVQATRQLRLSAFKGTAPGEARNRIEAE